MFKIAKDPTFRHTVTIKEPIDGGFASHSLDVTYRILTTDRLAEHNLGTNDGQIAFLRDVIANVDGAIDADDKPMEFNDQLLSILSGITYVRSALVNSYTQAVVAGHMGN